MRQRTFWLGMLVVTLIAAGVMYAVMSMDGQYADWSLVLLFAVFTAGAYMFFFQSNVKR